MRDKNIFLLFIVIIQNIITTLSASYYIKEVKGPSYMYRRFSYVREEIFPIDIRIYLSVSGKSGTLLYSIDRHMNQLVLSLNNVRSPVLVIQFRKQTFYEPLNKLCNCTMCRYVIWDIRVQMRSRIHLQCNMLTIKTIHFQGPKLLNKDYPIPYEREYIDGHNEAHLWLINTPQYGPAYPNNKQLTGCIFKVTYDDEPLVFTNITDDIGSECTRTCTDNICNGGTCYETYSKYPRCNCTMTFLNGKFCNDSKQTLNIQTMSPYWVFDVFKVSWKSTMKTLMVVNNSNINLLLYHKESTMKFEYKLTNRRLLVRSILSNNYDPYSESILIGSFSDMTIETEFYNNGSWYHTNIPTNRDLRQEIFTSITLISGNNGTIDFVFKSSLEDFDWKKINFSQFKNISMDDKKNESSVHQKKINDKQDDILPFITVSTITVIVTILVTLMIMEGSAVAYALSNFLERKI